jgi:plasmid stabilization system protein ParE
MRIRWTPAAAADSQRISDYLKEHHPHYRQPTIRKLFEAIRSLKQWPQRGRIGRDAHALCGGLPRERADHRSHADLSRCTGPSLNVLNRRSAYWPTRTTFRRFLQRLIAPGRFVSDRGLWHIQPRRPATFNGID